MDTWFSGIIPKDRLTLKLCKAKSSFGEPVHYVNTVNCPNYIQCFLAERGIHLYSQMIEMYPKESEWINKVGSVFFFKSTVMSMCRYYQNIKNELWLSVLKPWGQMLCFFHQCWREDLTLLPSLPVTVTCQRETYCWLTGLTLLLHHSPNEQQMQTLVCSPSWIIGVSSFFIKATWIKYSHLWLAHCNIPIIISKGKPEHYWKLHWKKKKTLIQTVPKLLVAINT